VPLRKSRVLLVVPINDGQYNDKLAEFLAPYVAADFTLDVRSISGGQPHIASRWDLQENGVHVSRLVYETRADYDGFFVSDFDGAGVEAAREVVRAPVIDGFLPQCMAALTLAGSFSILAPEDSLVSLDVSHPRQIGAAGALASVRSLGMTVAELADFDRTVDRVTEESKKAIEYDGALAIVLGCTAMIGVAAQASARLRAESSGGTRSLDVPVMDPNICGITYLQSLVRAGLAQCARSYQFPASLKPVSRG
jgi:Asp/Glu/hydantoin racemase